MAEGSLRLFVAIALPEPVREGIAPWLAHTAAIAPGARVVPLENLHLTLRFLGATPAARRAALERALDAVAAASAPFGVRLAGAGTFGPRSRPRVLFAAVAEGSAELASLAGRVRDGLGDREPDPRFTPHLTLARARGPRGDPALARARGELDALEAPPFVVRSLALFESQVSSRGSRYQILHEAAFPA